VSARVVLSLHLHLVADLSHRRVERERDDTRRLKLTSAGQDAAASLP
jgi:hypothetical protein